jgi:hypothetical protein
MPASLPVAMTVAALLAAPSLVTAGIYTWTGDPFLRWLGLTEERLAAADRVIETDDPYVRIRVYWRGPAHGYPDAAELSEALRGAFEVKGIEVHVAVLRLEGEVEGKDEGRNGGGGGTTIDMRAGRSTFGPFPVTQAARYVTPAAEAARLAHAPRAMREHNW